MKRLLLLMVMLTSYLNAGLYGGLEYYAAFLNGTYEETNKNTNVTEQWKMSGTANTVGINLGYGYADTVSGDIYFLIGNGGRIGTNFRYAFNPLANNLYPHLIVGVGLADIHPDLTDNPNTPDTETSIGTNTYFVQIGLGLSYVLNDTIELYGNALLVYNYDSHIYGSNYENKNISYGGTVDKVNVGFQIGVKFHTFGSSTIRGKYLKEEEQAIELEEERQKDIDAFIN